MSLKLARDRIAVLRDVVLRLEKTEDLALDPVMKASLGRLLLDYIAEFDAGVSIESPCQQHSSSSIPVRGTDGMAAGSDDAGFSDRRESLSGVGQNEITTSEQS